MIIAVGVAVGMVKTRKNGVIIEVNRRYIMLIIVLMAKFGVCTVIAVIDSILVSVGM